MALLSHWRRGYMGAGPQSPIGTWEGGRWGRSSLVCLKETVLHLCMTVYKSFVMHLDMSAYNFPPPQYPYEYVGVLYGLLIFFLFRFVLKQICLFLLFWCSKHSKKPKKLFYGFTKQTKIPDNSNRLSFSSFRFKLKIFSLCFEDTLITTQGPSAEYSEACIEDVDLPLLKK